MYCCVSLYLECILMDVVLLARQLWRPCTYQSDKCPAVKSRVIFMRKPKIFLFYRLYKVITFWGSPG